MSINDSEESSCFGGVIASVVPGSPADKAGLLPRMTLRKANGHPLRDLIDWRWYGDDEVLTLEIQEEDGSLRELHLTRAEGEDWGIDFTDLVFDGIKRCHNHCGFCFIRGLPAQCRPSLKVRDDDYRLSFLIGTFTTLTNCDEQDIERILEQGLSPLRVSLHASDASVRETLMGDRQAIGWNALERLLDAGIEMHMQIVLVPGINDGEVLESTLTWAWPRKGILTIGIVPVGYSRLSPLKATFDSKSAQAVLQTIAPFQARAEREGRGRWVYAADEFYGIAYGEALLTRLPDDEAYGDYELFEDGIGIVRTTIDEFHHAVKRGDAKRLEEALTLRSPRARVHLIVGEATMPWFDVLLRKSPLKDLVTPLPVKNDFFGGNVDVTGLLTGVDIAKAIEKDREQNQDLEIFYGLPRVIFNDQGFTLDDWTYQRLLAVTDSLITLVSLIADDWLGQLTDFIEQKQ